MSINICALTFWNLLLLNQLVEHKKRSDEFTAVIDTHEESKKKVQRDNETLQQKMQALIDENDKLVKSKKKLQSEVSVISPYCERFCSKHQVESKIDEIDSIIIDAVVDCTTMHIYF